MGRPLLAQINLAALAGNVALARARAPGAQLLAVVKADAYGHGLLRVLPALEEADGLALLELDMAIALREHHYTRRILLIEGFFEARELNEIAQRRLAIVVHHDDQVRMLEGATLPRPLEVFVKVNTGMNRLGFPASRLAHVVTRLRALGCVRTLTLMTHLASADEADGIAEPLALFRTIADGMDLPVSIANSAGVFRYHEIGGDVVRPGIMLYGSSPFATEAGTAAKLQLKAVMSLKSRIIAVQHVERGKRVGYGGAHRVERGSRIGIVACGYADGYPRHAPTGTPVLVDGHRAPITGRVSMDMIAVDLTALPGSGEGAEVELWGARLPVDEVAAAAGTISYELLCGVTQRVPVEVTGLDPEAPAAA